MKPTITAPTITAPTITAPTITAPTITAPAITAPAIITEPTAFDQFVGALKMMGETPDPTQTDLFNSLLKEENGNVEAAIGLYFAQKASLSAAPISAAPISRAPISTATLMKPIITSPISAALRALMNPDAFIDRYVKANQMQLLAAPQYRLAASHYNLRNFDMAFQPWKVIDTIGDGNCLTHAFLQCLSPAYGRMPTPNGSYVAKFQVAQAFRLAFAETDIARDKPLYRAGNGTAYLTDREIMDYSKLFNVITIVFDQPNQLAFGFGILAVNFDKGTATDNTPVIFIHGSGGHYSSIMTHRNAFVLPYSEAKTIAGLRTSLNF
jgi:hypothetical protein